jgi:polyhydroxyalkanoate synthesis regulator phasin
MIDQKKDTVPWSLLVSGLDDAREHLEKLVDEMAAKGSIDEEEFRVALGHIYAHLNRAWHSRDHSDEIEQKDWERFSRFPKDIEPVG